jgi:hypothetical protein
METVNDIVKREKASQTKRLKKYERDELAEKKKQDSKQFSGEVAYIIKQFEYNVFRFDSTNKKVADFILDYKGIFYVTYPGDLPQKMPGYIEVKPFMGAIKFERDEDNGRKYIGGSSKYNKWKKTLEKQFGVKIYIKREYRYEERYGSSGYQTYDDKIFCGVKASVRLVK